MYRRDWSIRESYKRHPYRVDYKMGVARDGRITAVKCRILADGGAYCSVTPWVTWRSTVQCCGPYVVENVHCDTLGVYTNNVVAGAMRGFGSPQMNFVVEQMVEIAAGKLGITGVEFRRRNMVRQGSVTITGQRLGTHKVAMGEVLDAVLRETGYEEKLARCSHGRSDGDELYGVGLAMSYRGVSLGAEGVDFCAAVINVQPDGSILLEVGVHENGQGAESAMSLIAAEELGVSVERIRYRRASTSTVPDSGTTVASRGTIMGGGAVTLAARELKRRIAEAVCGRLQCLAGAVRFEDGEILDPTGHRRISFRRGDLPHVRGAALSPRGGACSGRRASRGTSRPARATPTSRGSTDARRSSSRSNKKTGKVRLLRRRGGPRRRPRGQPRDGARASSSAAWRWRPATLSTRRSG